ncbi:MAG: hypothetical protein RI601_09885, partial [Desulfurivibrionaceae bacterium]|nr:hypothetical protein [Desulfurivibrionaceae bacterium]
SMELDKKVIGGHSATKRYYPVEKAIRYQRIGSFLYRSETPVTLAPDPFIANFTDDYPLLNHLDTSIANPLTFNYSPASLTRNALVKVEFTLSHKGTTLDFHKEIQVRNVP